MALLKHQRNRLIVLAILMLLGVVVLLGLRGIIPIFRQENVAINVHPPVTLNFWNVFEDKDIYAEFISDYIALNPYVKINYNKINYIEYREKLLDSFANGTSPDIFAIQNTWLPLDQDRIAPAPSSLPTVTLFKEIYPSVVSFDFVRETEGGERIVYALPLAIETLGLFYNKDYFETANITSPPKTWEELIDYAKLFTQLDNLGKIKLSGISLGTAENINRAVDIVSLLMMQGGARMNNPLLTEATFDDEIQVGEGEKKIIYKPGEEALEFYLAFSDNTQSVYSWDKDMSYSIDAFVEGKSAMMINYPHHIPVIKSKAPHLNFATSPVPQLQERSEDVNFASYWGFTVSENSLNIDEAWKFIEYLTQPENVKKYAEKTRLPVARRDLILWQQQDEELRHFTNQILSARSWYQGDYAAVEKILGDMIDSAKLGEQTIEEVLADAAARVTVVIQKIRE